MRGKPKKINEDNNNPASDNILIKAEEELYNKVFKNKNPLSKEQARNLTNCSKLSPIQFDVLYENYLTNYIMVENSLPETVNFVSNTNNQDSMYYKIDEFIKRDNFENLLSFEQFLNVIRGWITYDYKDKSDEEWYEVYKEKFFQNPNQIINYNNPEVDLNMIAFRTKNKQKALQNEDNSRPVTDNHQALIFPLSENKKKYQLHKVSKPNTYLIDI